VRRRLIARLEWEILVVPLEVRIDDHIIIFVMRSTRSRSSTFVELGRGSEVGLLDRLADGGGGLVDTERELHSFDGAGEGIVACFAVALLLYCSLSDHIAGVVTFEVGSLKLLNTPREI